MRNSFSALSLSLRHCLQNCSLFSLQDESDDEYCIGTSDCSSASGQHANIFSPVLSVSHNNARKSTTEVKIFKPFNSIIRSYHIIRWYRLYTTDPCLHHCSWCSVQQWAEHFIQQLQFTSETKASFRNRAVFSLRRPAGRCNDESYEQSLLSTALPQL